MGARAKQVRQKDLPDDEKCEGDICTSTDTRWTKICTKHQKQIDEVRARWNHQHEHGPDAPLTGEALAKFVEEHK